MKSTKKQFKTLLSILIDGNIQAAFPKPILANLKNCVGDLPNDLGVLVLSCFNGGAASISDFTDTDLIVLKHWFEEHINDQL